MEKTQEVATSNIIRVNSQRQAATFLGVSKKVLTTFETVELHSLGNAITLAARVADNLQRFGYATIIRTTISTEEVKREDGVARKPKMIIVLKRAADFKKKVEDFEKVRATKALETAK
jgi:DNA-binding XRE family transcriptional regulator